MKFSSETLLALFTVLLSVSLCASDENTGGCTTALIAGWAMPDGRPLLWKNRDISNWRQEFHYYDESPFSFIAVTYAGEDTQAWGGINEVGFAIEDANAYNFSDSSDVPDDDGIIQYHALQTCETVEDFLAYMDTTAQIGRTRPAVYGVFDAYGGGGMLEASLYENFWYDANDTSANPNGIQVRSNFARAVDTNHVGQHRYDRALELIEEAVTNRTISPRFLFDIVARDLITEEIDPYPLPFDGYFIFDEDTLWHSIRDDDAINRQNTHSSFVAQGIRPGENPLTSTLWAQVGKPVATPTVPLWVAAESVPVEVDCDSIPLICIRARRLFKYLYFPYPDPDDNILNTYKLVDYDGEGVLTQVRRIEEGYYDFIESTIENWRTNFPPQAEMKNLQDSIASVAYRGMIRPAPVNGLVLSLTPDSLRLSWAPVLRSLCGDTIAIDGYSIYYSERYSPENLIGDSLGFTQDTTYAAPLSLFSGSAFFQVRTVNY